MIAIGEKYDELEFINFGEMLLVNPDEKLEQAHFFIKERDARIKELSNNKCIQYEVRDFTIGRVTLYLMLLIFDDNYDIIYGQWINICNQTDRRNFLGLNFADNIYFVLLSEGNKVKYVQCVENPFKNRVNELFIKIDKDKAWSKKEFEMAVSTFNGYKSRREFYEELLENQIYPE